jgi:hypothetical protein
MPSQEMHSVTVTAKQPVGCADQSRIRKFAHFERNSLAIPYGRATFIITGRIRVKFLHVVFGTKIHASYAPDVR